MWTSCIEVVSLRDGLSQELVFFFGHFVKIFRVLAHKKDYKPHWKYLKWAFTIQTRREEVTHL